MAVKDPDRVVNTVKDDPTRKRVLFIYRKTGEPDDVVKDLKKDSNVHSRNDGKDTITIDDINTDDFDANSMVFHLSAIKTIEGDSGDDDVASLPNQQKFERIRLFSIVPHHRQVVMGLQPQQ